LNTGKFGLIHCLLFKQLHQIWHILANIILLLSIENNSKLMAEIEILNLKNKKYLKKKFLVIRREPRIFERDFKKNFSVAAFFYRRKKTPLLNGVFLLWLQLNEVRF